MSDAFAGIGTVFKLGDGTSSESFTALAEVNSINGLDVTRDVIETTSLDTVGGYKTFIGGSRDPGEAVLEMNFTRDNYVTLLAEIDEDDSRNFQIVLSDTGETTFDFAGIVTILSMSVTFDDKVTMSCTIKASGQHSISS